MPEKPEVMCVAKNLNTRLIGKKITGCNIYWDNIIATDLSEFKKNIIGEHINKISTRGKFIVLTLDHYSLLIHLRMEGKFVFRNVGEELGKHEHVELILDNSISFRYHDVRKFGKMYLIPIKDTYNVKPLSDLGPDFYDSISPDYLYEKIHKLKLPIKSILLNQRIICGIGNIYADEILFSSNILPTRSGNSISRSECEKIITNTKVILKEAYKYGGTTIKSFTSSEGVHGNFQNKLLVHGKEKCPVCNNLLVKIKIGGRGTYFCPKCQK